MPIPPNIRAAIDRYVYDRVRPGPFTLAVLENRLDAVTLADEESYANLRDIYVYVYNSIPSIAWGSPERVRSWLKGETQKLYGFATDTMPAKRGPKKGTNHEEAKGT